MFKSFFESAEVKTLKEANSLMKKQMKKERVIEMLNKFIRPLIWDFDAKKGKIDSSLSDKSLQFALIIKIDDEYAHKDILGENYERIEEKVDEYNKLVGEERLEAAKVLWADFKKKLEDLEKGYMVDYEIPREKIEKNKRNLRGTI